MIDYMQKDGVLHSLDMQTSAKANFMQRFTDVILAPRNMPHRMQFMGPTGTNAVEAAIKLMQSDTSSREAILDIALEVGFNSTSTFYNAFRKVTGQTPGAYRQRMLSKA